jgi:hypothetical protein
MGGRRRRHAVEEDDKAGYASGSAVNRPAQFVERVGRVDRKGAGGARRSSTSCALAHKEKEIGGGVRRVTIDEHRSPPVIRCGVHSETMEHRGLARAPLAEE